MLNLAALPQQSIFRVLGAEDSAGQRVAYAIGRCSEIGGLQGRTQGVLVRSTEARSLRIHLHGCACMSAQQQRPAFLTCNHPVRPHSAEPAAV